MRFGVFALDPGGSSGLAWGVVQEAGSVAERIAAMESAGTATVSDPDWLEQAKQIAARWRTFRDDCQAQGILAYYVCEDFILTHLGSSDRTGLYPVWIGAATVGILSGSGEPVDVWWQQPSVAKTYATDERLKRWGLWVRGKEHERDACRHLALFLATERAAKMRAARAKR